MSNLMHSIVLALLLLNARASAFGHPPAQSQQEPRQSEQAQQAGQAEQAEQAEQAPETKQTPAAESEHKEEANDAEGDEDKGPTRQPGLLPLQRLAQVDLGALPVGPALLFEDSLIVVTEAAAAMRLDSKTGELLWKLGLPGSRLLPPSLMSETLLIVDRSGTLFLVDPATGVIAKELSTGISPSLPPTWQENVVFLATPDAVIIGYDIDKTQEIWRAAVQDTPLAMAVGGDLLVVSDQAGALHALDSKSGLMRWQFQGRGTFPAPAVFDSKNERIFIGDTKGVFYSLSARNGKVHYRWPTGAAIPLSPLVEEDRVYVATFANTLFCYRSGNGHELWRANLPGRPAASPERARRRVVVVTFDGQVAEYGSGGTSDTPIYTAPTEILPAPTLTPGGLALPLRSGQLLLLQTMAPPPKITPGEEGALEGETPAQRNPAQRDPAQRNPAQRDPAQRNPAQRNPAQRNPAQRKPAQRKPAHCSDHSAVGQKCPRERLSAGLNTRNRTPDIAGTLERNLQCLPSFTPSPSGAGASRQGVARNERSQTPGEGGN